MGYTTQFSGALLFNEELTASQIRELQSICGSDLRDRDDCPQGPTGDLTHFDVGLNDDYTGLEWDGSEKTYELVEKFNWLIDHMRQRWPNFGLKGEMLAQGEDIRDRWILKIGEDGRAKGLTIDFTGKVVTCPNCEHVFAVDAE